MKLKGGTDDENRHWVREHGVGVIASPSIVSAAFFETQDGAKIYYEDHGKGDVILLVHGWMCSSKFWKANVPELAKEFRVSQSTNGGTVILRRPCGDIPFRSTPATCGRSSST